MPIILLSAGCFQSPLPDPKLSDLESPDPALRVRAIRWAGAQKMTEAVPLLVDRLQEQDRSVRFFAIEALRRITGQDFGFDYKAGAHQRAEAVKRWRKYLDSS